jgi:hypothetical protein
MSEISPELSREAVTSITVRRNECRTPHEAPASSTSCRPQAEAPAQPGASERQVARSRGLRPGRMPASPVGCPAHNSPLAQPNAGPVLLAHLLRVGRGGMSAFAVASIGPEI